VALDRFGDRRPRVARGTEVIDPARVIVEMTLGPTEQQHKEFGVHDRQFSSDLAKRYPRELKRIEEE
jgi:hypothetical protein